MHSSVIVMLALVCLTGRVLSCAPCTCSLHQSGDRWPGLQVARCASAGFTAVPSTDKLPGNTQVLYISEGSTIPKINDDQFVAFTKLLQIYIESSKVNKVERNAFRNMTDVTVIQLGDNLLTELPVGLFSHTPRLAVASFYLNKLKVLPEALFSNLSHLKTVWLNNNEITSIEANCFANVPRLETVHLFNNKLTTLNLNIFDVSSSLKVLSLSSNPWHCDESLCGVMAAVVSRELWGEWSRPSCVTPQSLQGKMWADLKEHALLLQCLHPAHPSLTLPTNITHLHVTEHAQN